MNRGMVTRTKPVENLLKGIASRRLFKQTLTFSIGPVKVVETVPLIYRASPLATYVLEPAAELSGAVSD